MCEATINSGRVSAAQRSTHGGTQRRKRGFLDVTVGMLGCVPGHPLFAAVVAALPDSIAWLPGRPPNEQTGPQFFSRVLVEREALGLETATVFGAELFYPYRPTEPHRAGEHFPQAYAAHHWSRSWVGAAGISGVTGR